MDSGRLFSEADSPRSELGRLARSRRGGLAGSSRRRCRRRGGCTVTQNMAVKPRRGPALVLAQDCEISFDFRDHMPPGKYKGFCRKTSVHRDKQYKRWLCLLQFDVLDVDGLRTIGGELCSLILATRNGLTPGGEVSTGQRGLKRMVALLVAGTGCLRRCSRSASLGSLWAMSQGRDIR